MAKRKNTLTRWIEDMVDDTKDFVDDILDRSKDLESNVKDAVTDVVDDDESVHSSSSAQMTSFQAALADLTAKVNQLASASAASSKA
jgi:polyhydroxyalkanoate synthesis regulator phasin